MDYQEFAQKIRQKYPGSYDDMDDMSLAKKIVQKYPQYSDVQFEPQQKSFLQKGWDALAEPEQMSKDGLTQLAQAVPNPAPSGNILADIVRGTPRIAADTMAEVAPKFVSRGSILTAGAAKALGAVAPLGKLVGRGLGSQLESASGAVPGSLEAAYNDPTLILSEGKAAAGPLYQAAKAELEEGANLFKGMYKPEEIYDTAQEYLSKGGKLEPSEALTVRKAIDKLMKSGRYIKDELIGTRQAVDQMAKGSANIAQADPMFQRGIQAESLRNLLPQNKFGGASAFKTLLLKLTGGLAAPVLSPAVQGVGATGAGLAARNIVSPLINNPIAGAALTSSLNLLRQRRKDQQKANSED